MEEHVDERFSELFVTLSFRLDLGSLYSRFNHREINKDGDLDVDVSQLTGCLRAFEIRTEDLDPIDPARLSSHLLLALF